MKKIILFTSYFCIYFSIAQSLDGHVFYSMDTVDVPLQEVKVSWLEHPVMETTTDENGYYKLHYHAGLYHIKVEKKGFKTQIIRIDSLVHTDVYLVADESISDLEKVEIFTRFTTKIKKENVGMEYKIGKAELKKAPCCNLSESFDTNTSVDVSFSNPITGLRQIRLLGLEQRYVSISLDGLPQVRGLTIGSGMSYIPGRWIASIDLSKGASCNTNSDAIAGAIQVNPLIFNGNDTHELNLFINQNLRTELNYTTTRQLSENWSTSVLTHASGRFQKIDTNNDGFLDTPLMRQVNFMALLRYSALEENGWFSQTGVQAISDENKSGQLSFFNLSNPVGYGVMTHTRSVHLWNKTSYNFLGKPGTSIAFTAKWMATENQTIFGNDAYQGEEQYFITNLWFQSIIGDTRHKYSLGITAMHNPIAERIFNSYYERTENNFGLFADYTYTGDKLTFTLAARNDIHNLAGNQFLPKALVKYDVFKNSTLRASIARSFRTANIFAENFSYFISNRSLDILPSPDGKIYGLLPELAWNYGVSWVQEFNLFGRKSSLTADFFRTDFTRQILADLDTATNKVVFYNQPENSFTNSFQLEWNVEPVENLNLRWAYKKFVAKAELGNQFRDIPFIPRDRGFLNAEYTFGENGKKWSFDATLQWYGKLRLPDTSSSPLAFQRPDVVGDFFIVNAQISKELSKKSRVYVGVENLTSYTQNNPIIQPENPFGSYFDTSFVYAPIMPAMLYLGVDFSF